MPARARRALAGLAIAAVTLVGCATGTAPAPLPTLGESGSYTRGDGVSMTFWDHIPDELHSIPLIDGSPVGTQQVRYSDGFTAWMIATRPSSAADPLHDAGDLLDAAGWVNNTSHGHSHGWTNGAWTVELAILDDVVLYDVTTVAGPGA